MRRFMVGALASLAVALVAFTWGITLYENNRNIRQMIPALCGALFVCCMVCHGELARRRPHPHYLTQFYLMVSVGGAIGGLFVAFVSPRLFHDYQELPIAMVGCAVLVTCVLWNQAPWAARATLTNMPKPLATRSSEWPLRFHAPFGVPVFFPGTLNASRLHERRGGAQ